MMREEGGVGEEAAEMVEFQEGRFMCLNLSYLFGMCLTA